MWGLSLSEGSSQDRSLLGVSHESGPVLLPGCVPAGNAMSSTSLAYFCFPCQVPPMRFELMVSRLEGERRIHLATEAW